MFQPSSYSDTSGSPSTPAARRDETRKLEAALRRTSGRIARWRASIRRTKVAIQRIAAHKAPVGPLVTQLHSLEHALHRDAHLLRVLRRVFRHLAELPAAGVAAAVEAEAHADRGEMTPEAKVPGYPPPPVGPPPPKSPEQVVVEVEVELRDPAAADRHDAAVVGGDPDHDDHDHEATASLSVGAGSNIPLLHRPLFWLGAGAVGLAYYNRAALERALNRS